MGKPTEKTTIVDVLRYYSEVNPKKGKMLAEYLDFLEDCACYSIELEDDYVGDN